jgi:hypothetical protein
MSDRWPLRFRRLPVQFSPRPAPVLASALAAGIMLALGGCGQVSPVGPEGAAAPPAIRRLGSPIILQVMRTQPATVSGKCPAGYAGLSDPGSAGTCYSKLGTPVTVTSAGLSPVSAQGQSAVYGFAVAVPAGDVAAVTAAIKQAYDVHGALAIDVEGKIWSAPQVLAAFSGQQLQIALPGKGEALELHRILAPSG